MEYLINVTDIIFIIIKKSIHLNKISVLYIKIRAIILFGAMLGTVNVADG